MNPDALKAALGKLLSHGEKAKDQSMMEMAKKGKPAAPDLCPECHVPLIDGGKCPKCGYTKPEETQNEGESASEDSGEGLAGILEQAGRS